jgi:hypothetical protein
LFERDDDILNATAICICSSSGDCGAFILEDDCALELLVRRWAREEFGFWRFSPLERFSIALEEDDEDEDDGKEDEDDKEDEDEDDEEEDACTSTLGSSCSTLDFFVDWERDCDFDDEDDEEEEEDDEEGEVLFCSSLSSPICRIQVDTRLLGTLYKLLCPFQRIRMPSTRCAWIVALNHVVVVFFSM